MGIGQYFHIGAAILSTTLDKVTSTILAQLGSVTEDGNVPFSDNVEVYGQIGLASRPSNPVKGQNAAECIALKGDRDIIIAARDVRGQAIYGNLKPGETCLFACGPDGLAQGKVFIKDDGTIYIGTTSTNIKGGDEVSMSLGPTEFVLNFPWGNLTWSQAGLFLRCLPSGAGFSIGSMGGGPGGALGVALSALGLGSYANVTADVVGLRGQVVELGNGDNFMPCLIAAAKTPAEIAASPGPLTLMAGPPPLGNQSVTVKVSTGLV